jgi:apolipoprotein N-acyltransferase
MVKVLPLLVFFLAPALSGILLALAFPNHLMDWLAWLAFVPFFLAIRGKKPWQTLLMGWLCGVVFFLGITPWWIKEFRFVSPLASGLGYLYLGLYFALFGLFLSWLSKIVRSLFLIAAPVWVTIEFLRANISFLAFPWALLGHTQYHNIPIIQMASFTGVYGVSFIIVMANAAISGVVIHFLSPSPPDLILQKQRRFASGPVFQGLLVLAIILGLWGWGRLTLNQGPYEKPLSVAVVQGNIPQKIKWNREYREQILSKYEVLTEEAVKSEPRLIIWPETATPGFVLNDRSLLQRIVTLAGQGKAYLLIGSAEYPKFSRPPGKISLSKGNTALLLSPQGRVLGQYLKMRLVPFGEYIPYQDLVPWPDFIVQKGKRNFDIAGTEATLFRIGGDPFGTLICWEVLFPDLTRDLVKKGAVFAVNLTNEAWFGKIAFPHQMLSSCVFRAVENRINLVRCANTGISCFIDPWGRVTNRVTQKGEDSFIEGTLTQTIYLNHPGTIYTRCGDILVYLCITFLFGLLVFTFWKKKSGRFPLESSNP